MEDIFDRSVLKSLRELESQTGQDIVSEMVTEFVSDTGEYVKKMRSHVDSSNFSDLARVAHSLKSSSANVGATAISNLCEHIESQILNDKDYDQNKLNQMVSEVEKVLAPTLEYLKAAA